MTVLTEECSGHCPEQHHFVVFLQTELCPRCVNSQAGFHPRYLPPCISQSEANAILPTLREVLKEDSGAREYGPILRS